MLGVESLWARQRLCAAAVDSHIVTSAPDLRAVTDGNRAPITIVYRILRSANRSERTVQNYIESVALLSAFRPGTVRSRCAGRGPPGILHNPAFRRFGRKHNRMRGIRDLRLDIRVTG